MGQEIVVRSMGHGPPKYRTTHGSWATNSVVRHRMAHGSWAIVMSYGPWVMGQKSLKGVSRGLEVRCGLLQFTFPPLKGGTLKVGARKESLTRRVSVLLLIAEVNALALGLKCFQLFWFSSIELIQIRDGEFTII